MALSDVVNTLGQTLLRQYGERVHKLALHAGFTCPNRDGSKGRGGCSFCNNRSFNPNARRPPTIAEQIGAGRRVMARRTGARRFIAYFQAYTNTYDAVERLRALYDEALAEPDVIGLAVGTRPDCVPPAVLELLADYQDRGVDVWLELGLQSAFDATLERINRGHTFADYRNAARAAQEHGLRVCCHLIVGLPGESAIHNAISLQRVLELGVQGLKLHPLHVVRGTRLANEWRHGLYRPLHMASYVRIAADLIAQTPANVVYHRVTGTAGQDVLLAPDWCSRKWSVLNAIERELLERGASQGSATAGPHDFTGWRDMRARENLSS